MDNNSSRLLKHFGEIEVTCPETVMTSRVMLRDEDRLLGREGKVDKPSSFSAQKEYLFALDTTEKDKFDEVDLTGNNQLETERNQQNSERMLKSDVKEATPDSEFLLNSEIVNVNQFEPVRVEKPKTEKNQMNEIQKEEEACEDKIQVKKGKEGVTPLVFGENLRTINTKGREMNPFSIEDPRTERSEYPSEYSGQKTKSEAIQNSMKNKNFIMSAGKGKRIIEMEETMIRT